MNYSLVMSRNGDFDDMYIAEVIFQTVVPAWTSTSMLDAQARLSELPLWSPMIYLRADDVGNVYLI
jgi:hypothetical protein